MRARIAALFAAALGSACGTTYSASDGAPVDTVDTVIPDVMVVSDVSAAADTSPPPPTDAGTVVDAGRGPPYPLVLQHGFAGWDMIGPVNYFYDVASDLTAHGESVFESDVAPFASSTMRAQQLAMFVDRVLAATGSAKVDIIAHSQGGLDSRELISSMGYGDRVALLVTVATPHRGTALADALLGTTSGLSGAFLDAVATVLGESIYDVQSDADLRGSLTSLSVANASAFNASNPDDPRVLYWSWAGRSNYRTGEVQCSGARFPNDPTHVSDPGVLGPFADYLEQGDPIAHVNDGLVEVASARWGSFMGCVPADHFDEIGQVAETGPVEPSGFDHIAFYEQVASLIRAAGL